MRDHNGKPAEMYFEISDSRKKTLPNSFNPALRTQNAEKSPLLSLRKTEI